MKKNMKFLSVFLFLNFLLTTSCNHDNDVPPPVDNTSTENPDNEHEISKDYVVLKALYEANPNNTLGWNLDDTRILLI